MELADFQGVEPPARVLCALSGGADSIAMTHLAMTLGYRVTALHLNHQLRGAESTRDEQFVRDFCEQYQIPLVVACCDIQKIAAEQKIGLEECGRNERYRFFECQANDLMGKTGEPVWIATAHTLSDHVETVLMRLVRGSGLAGLGGIAAKRGQIIRPLLGFARQEIEEYCQVNKLDYVVDSSNADCRYTRNFLRHEIVPKLEQLNPNFLQTVASMTKILQQDEDALQVCAQRYVGEDDKVLSVADLKTAPKAVQARVVQRFCKQHEIPCSYELLERLLRLVKKGSGREEGKKSLFFSLSKGMLTIRTHAEWENVCVQENSTEKVPLFGVFTSKTGKRYKIQTLETSTSKTFHKIYKNTFDIWLDCGKICGSVWRRTRIPSDAIKLAENRPTKRVKKLFSEAQLPLVERDKRFILADDEGVIAIEGMGVAMRVACDERTTRALHIKQLDDKNKN